MTTKKILHLCCSDAASDSSAYNVDGYDVIKVTEKVDVREFKTGMEIYGIFANPPCTEFSTAQGFDKFKNIDKGMELVNICLDIIQYLKPVFWVLENPANGRLKDIIGPPKYVYQPWEYGAPYTKKTALWGDFNVPEKTYNNWESVTKRDLYIKKGRSKPGLDCLHKSAIFSIPEFYQYRNGISNDSDFRSLCWPGFSKSFFNVNK